MKALVTGAAGFIGSNLVKRLLKDGHEVVGIDSLTDYYDQEVKRSNLESIKDDKFRIFEEDLHECDLGRLTHDIDWIFHQAGQPGVRQSWGKDFNVYLDANVSATQKLLEAVVGSGSLKRFVYASSSSVYGDAESFPTTEDVRPRPLSPYGVTKLAAEHLCSLYAANFEVPTVSLRYFTVYGPGQRPDMAFTRFVQAAVTGGKINIFGTGEQIRDFTFVDDVVEANLAAAQRPSEPGAVFNVAGGSNISINSVLSMLGDLNDKPLDVGYTEKVAGDVWRTGGSTQKIKNELGWTATTSLREGLSRHLEWGRATF